MTYIPGYLRLHRQAKLAERARLAGAMLECRCCAHHCRVDRRSGVGRCRAGLLAEIGGYDLHFGEEDVLVGRGGSGTIFFARCTLNCSFCQNYDLSQQGGTLVEARELAEIMLELQGRGAVNINLVSPTHFIPPILAALVLAAEVGLTIPLVWNTGGYDSLAGLQLLAGVVDIYLPDMKFAEPGIAQELTGATDYPRVNFQAVAQMQAQVGRLKVEGGTAVSGLLVRHLVLPGGLAGSQEVLRNLAVVDPGAYVNVMGQYYPCYKAVGHPLLGQPVSRQEVREAEEYARSLGLNLV